MNCIADSIVCATFCFQFSMRISDLMVGIQRAHAQLCMRNAAWVDDDGPAPGTGVAGMQRLITVRAATTLILIVATSRRH